MAFKPGDPKPENAGRKKGTPNKSTIEFKAVLETYGIDPTAKLAEILPNLPAEKQADIYMRLHEYLYPKRKALEAVVEAQVDQQSSDEEQRSLLEEFSKLMKELTLRGRRFDSK